MSSDIGVDVSARRGVAAGDLGIGTMHHQSVQFPDIDFRQRGVGQCQLGRSGARRDGRWPPDDP